MAFLKILSGALEGRQIEIDRDTMSIGRAPDADIQIADASCSGHHCSITREGRRYTLRDLGSTNGTLVNGEEIVDIPLKPGDRISAGAIEMVFDGADVEVPEPQPEPAVAAPRVVPTPARTPPSAGTTPFRTRTSQRYLWIVVAIVAVILVAGAFVYFFSRLPPVR